MPFQKWDEDLKLLCRKFRHELRYEKSNTDHKTKCEQRKLGVYKKGLKKYTKRQKFLRTLVYIWQRGLRMFIVDGTVENVKEKKLKILENVSDTGEHR